MKSAMTAGVTEPGSRNVFPYLDSLTDGENGEDGGVGHKAGERGSPDAEGEERTHGGRGRGVGPVHLGVEPDGVFRGGEVGGDGGEEEEARDDVDDDQINHEPAMQYESYLAITELANKVCPTLPARGRNHAT